jgi:hypothetical protein
VLQNNWCFLSRLTIYDTIVNVYRVSQNTWDSLVSLVNKKNKKIPGNFFSVWR